MKRRAAASICALLFAAALLPSSPVQANSVINPTIHEREAEESLARFLHKYPVWRYRIYGYIDCSHGRVNRYTWACRFGYVKGRVCRRGRAQIRNEVREGGFTYYLVHSNERRC